MRSTSSTQGDPTPNDQASFFLVWALFLLALFVWGSTPEVPIPQIHAITVPKTRVAPAKKIPPCLIELSMGRACRF